jgi:ferritin
MKTTVVQSMNKQINAELYSSYLYLSMAAWANSKGYKGIANWLQIQSKEEYAHAMKFYAYLEERNQKPELEAIEKPENSWNGIIQLFEAVYAHELKVTSLINNLYTLSQDEKDHASTSFLKWFIDEQVEEEATVCAILDEIKLAGETGPGMYMIDKELAQRIFVDPTTTTAQ